MKYTFVILTLLFLVSCENDVDAPDWPDHDPKFVITASLRLEGDSVFVFCRVSSTMSLGEEYRVDRAMINDADVRVRHDGVAWPIALRSNYYPYDYDVNYAGVVPRGSTEIFLLTVQKGDWNASATLEIPDLPLEFDLLKILEYDPFWFRGEMYFKLLTPLNRMSYSMLLESYYETSGWHAYNFDRYIIEDTYRPITDGTFWFETSFEKQRIRYTLSARSPEYLDYENSRWYSGSGDSPFEPEPNNPAFNIDGDGIGFFWYELVGEPVEIQY